MDKRIQRAIEAMNANFDEPLSIRYLAEVAALSPFHFSRTFRRVTGVSPGRFLYAVRIQQAKRLLTMTSLRVSDISYSVGYNSVGTFTTRFTASVGISPTRFRYARRHDLPPVEHQSPGGSGATLRGQLSVRPGTRVRTVILAVFGSPVAEGRPVLCMQAQSLGDWVLKGVPDGSYYVLAAASVDCWSDAARPLPMRDPALVGRAGPVVTRLSSSASVNIRLHPWQPTHVPLLVPLPCVTAPCNGSCRPPAIITHPAAAAGSIRPPGVRAIPPVMGTQHLAV